MISYEEHLERILGSLPAPKGEDVDVSGGALAAAAGNLCGRVLAADVVSRVALPGFTNSAMDGYAVRIDEIEVGRPIRVSGDIPAGDTRTLAMEPGQVWRIMTGARVPDGADAIIPVEMSDGGTETVTFSEKTTAGKHLRLEGEDVTPGDVVLPAGTQLAPHHIAVLASSGVRTCTLYARPRIAIISTGDELKPAGSSLASGQIHDSNGPMLAALATAAGAEVFSVQHVRDEENDVQSALSACVGEGAADLVITTGGVSAGAFDVVKGALLDAGEVTFDKVAMQPGKPQGFGVLGARRVPVFTLPGNPMSTLVSFHVFVLPAIRRMSGAPAPAAYSATVEQGWKPTEGRTQFARVQVRRARPKETFAASDSPSSGVRHELVIVPNTRQGSHHLGELAWANALAIVPREVEIVSAGDELTVMPLLGESWR